MPVVFATPDKGKKCLTKFCAFIGAHKGHPENIVEEVYNMSPTFISAVEQKFKSAAVTVDWFRVAQTYTKAVDDVRKLEAWRSKLLGNTRRAVRKSTEKILTQNQESALLDLVERDCANAKVYRVKELLRGVRRTNRSRPPSGASPIFTNMLSSTLLTTIYWNPCAAHWPALRGICRESFIVGIP